MTYAELQAKIKDQSHRKDMDARIPGFIDDARNRINSRLGLALAPLVNPDDTNDVLTNNDLLYFYPACQAMYEFIGEFETASYFQNKWQGQADGYYVTRTGTTPLVITPENPAP
jgi:hypothetical protein